MPTEVTGGTPKKRPAKRSSSKKPAKRSYSAKRPSSRTTKPPSSKKTAKGGTRNLTYDHYETQARGMGIPIYIGGKKRTKEQLQRAIYSRKA